MAEKKYLRNISELPEGIVHNILSCLSSKDALRAGASCKGWYAAWCTRPNLLFTNVEFSPELLGRNHKTMSRYRNEKIGVHSLKIFTNDRKLAIPEVIEQWGNWIQIAVGNGVKIIEYCPYVRQENWLLLSPKVFQAESLVELHIRGCDLKLQGSEIIRCYNLKRLSLLCSSFDEWFFQKIISSCRLIENLDIGGFNSSGTLKTWISVNSSVEIFESWPCIWDEGWLLLPSAVFQAESLVDLHIRGCELKLQGCENTRITCCNLKHLSLDHSIFEEQVFEEIISGCPLIEKLTIRNSVGFGNLRVLKLEKLKCLQLCLVIECHVEVQSSSLEEFDCQGDNEFVTLTLHACPSLKKLTFFRIFISGELLSNLGCKAPQLHYLSSCLCYFPPTSVISSQSLKKLTMMQSLNSEEVEIDVPSLESLEFQFDETEFGQPPPQFTVTAMSARCTFKIDGNINMVHSPGINNI